MDSGLLYRLSYSRVVPYMKQLVKTSRKCLFETGLNGQARKR